MYGLLKSRNQAMNHETLDFLRRLIQTPSPSLMEGEAAQLIEEEMKALGYDKVSRDDAGNVIGIIYGIEGDPALVLNSHMDTVETTPSARWETAPYGALMKGNSIYGSGAADCKGGLAAQVYAGALLKRSLLPLKGTLVVAATTAEENGCSLGVRELFKKTLPSLGLKPGYAILGEPSGLGLYYGHDGRVELDIRIEGSNPFQVNDAARSIYSEISRDGENGAGANIEVRQPLFANTGGMRHASIRVAKRLQGSESASNVLTQIRHETKFVAQSAQAMAVQVAVCEEEQMLYNGTRTLVKHVVDAWATDPFHPLMERSRQALAAAGIQVRTGKWQLGRMGMGTAGGVLTREFGIPVIGYGPGDETQAHSQNESVDVRKVYEAVYGTAAIVHSLVGIPVFGWTSDEI